MYPEALQLLIDEFAKLPTVGPKTAKRLAFHILNAPEERAHSLARALVDVKRKVRTCSVCGNVSGGELCSICDDSRRDAHVICVVATARDLAALEAPGVFHGVYHVLGGLLSPIDGVGPSSLRIDELLARIDDSVEEVILATNPTVAGESTALYLQKVLADRAVRITRIAQGLPIGADMEYADALTLKLSLDGRHSV